MSEAIRIGDAERDAAVQALGEHFAAGRLTRDEFDERAAVAGAARFDADLRPVFHDLPEPSGVIARVEPPAVRSQPRRRIPWLAPLLLVPMIVGIAFAAGRVPWLLVALVVFLVVTRRPGARGHGFGPPARLAFHDGSWRSGRRR